MQSPEPVDNWSTLEPHFNALRDVELAPGQIAEWLTRWSDLEKRISEAISMAYRAKSEDTTNAAEQTFRYLVEEIQPKVEVAAQALKHKLLVVPNWEPGPEHAQLVRRFRNEVELFREENVPLYCLTERMLRGTPPTAWSRMPGHSPPSTGWGGRSSPVHSAALRGYPRTPGLTTH